MDQAIKARFQFLDSLWYSVWNSKRIELRYPVLIKSVFVVFDRGRMKWWQKKNLYQGHHCNFFTCIKIKDHTHPPTHTHTQKHWLCIKTKLQTQTQILSNQAVYNQHLQLVLLSFSYTLAHAYIFSPFCLFSEVARPLSKVCFAKGRVHFHIFPFDMRRLSIQGYVFLSCFLPLPILLLSLCSSRCSAHSLIPVPCSTRCLLACLLGGSWEDVTQTITEQLPGRETLAFVYVCVCVCVTVCEYVYSHTIAGKCMWDECQCECGVVNNRGADGNTWSQLFPLPLCVFCLSPAHL